MIATEIKETTKEHDEDIFIRIFPQDFDILLDYGYDGEQCHYELKEEE